MEDIKQREVEEEEKKIYIYVRCDREEKKKQDSYIHTKKSIEKKKMGGKKQREGVRDVKKDCIYMWCIYVCGGVKSQGKEIERERERRRREDRTEGEKSDKSVRERGRERERESMLL
jgi:hypothetical protein